MLVAADSKTGQLLNRIKGHPDFSAADALRYRMLQIQNDPICGPIERPPGPAVWRAILANPHGGEIVIAVHPASARATANPADSRNQRLPTPLIRQDLGELRLDQ
jgi:hypothetical protein